MSNLIPTPIVDKNGVTSVRHKKPVTAASGKSIPAPPVPGKSSVSPSAEQKRWRVGRSWKGSDGNIQRLCRNAYNAQPSFDCSDDEAYDVLRVVSSTNVLPLLAVGIRSADEAREFLREIELEYRLDDNNDLVDKMVARGIPAHRGINFIVDNQFETYKESFVDAMEVAISPEYETMQTKRNADDRYPQISDMVLDGDVSYSDLKVLGTEMLERLITKHNGQGTNAHWKSLYRLKKDGNFSAEQMRDAVLFQEKQPNGNPSAALTVLRLYGNDFLEQVKDLPNMLARASQHEEMIDYNDDRLTTEDRIRIALYRHTPRREGYGPGIPPEDMTTLDNAGVGLREAAEGLENGLSVDQILAVHSGATSKPLVDGWL